MKYISNILDSFPRSAWECSLGRSASPNSKNKKLKNLFYIYLSNILKGICIFCRGRGASKTAFLHWSVGTSRVCDLFKNIFGFYLILLLILLSTSSIYAVEVIFNDGKSNLDIRFYSFPEDDYFPLDDIIKIFPEATYHQKDARQLIIKCDDIEFQLIIGNSYVNYAEKSYKLYAVPKLVNGIVLIPWEFVQSLLSPALGKQIAWNWNKTRLEVLSEFDLSEHSTINEWLEEANGYSNKETKIVIVIDAGHGGDDPGAIGANGLYEKEVVLDVALIMQEMIEEQLKIRAYLTRTDDTFVDLGKRTAIANQVEATLFISLHANAFTDSRLNGYEIYYLSTALNDRARTVASIENSVIRMEGLRQAGQTRLDLILWELAQEEYLEESKQFAEIISEEMSSTLSNKNRGVHQAEFFVLNGAYMPAILLEIGYISNPIEEKLMKTNKFKKDIASSLCNAIRIFLEENRNWSRIDTD